MALRILHRGELVTNIVVTRSPPSLNIRKEMPPNAANLKYMIELTKEWNECLILPKLRPSICFFMLYLYTSIATNFPSLKRLYICISLHHTSTVQYRGMEFLSHQR